MKSKTPKKPRKKSVRKQTWTIEIEHYDDGSTTMRRTNDGFTAIELVGLSHIVSSDIIDQIAGKVKPTRVERKVLVD